jgi:hypothetical protein
MLVVEIKKRQLQKDILMLSQAHPQHFLSHGDIIDYGKRKVKGNSRRHLEVEGLMMSCKVCYICVGK